MTRKSGDAGPHIILRQESAECDVQTRRWNISWLLRNSDRHALRIQSLRLPHNQFNSEETIFDPPVDLNGGEDLEIHTPVRCDEPPGHVTDNAFVILDVIWLGDAWRLFVRLRVLVSPAGKPATETQL